jgi:hypothetical protein
MSVQKFCNGPKSEGTKSGSKPVLLHMRYSTDSDVVTRIYETKIINIFFPFNDAVYSAQFYISSSSYLHVDTVTFFCTWTEKGVWTR